MQSPIHKDGLVLGALLASTALLTSKLSKLLVWLFGLMAAFTFYFFRDPERSIPADEDAILSPADGKIVSIDTLEHAPFIEGPARRISIFLSIFDVHINRSPIAGTITYKHYNPGDFFPAYAPKASLKNEQNTIGIEKDGYKVLVKQIAGIIARRINCWKGIGDDLAGGERFGLIRFGSRTELYLPLNSSIVVKVGESVKGGSSIIARRA